MSVNGGRWSQMKVYEVILYNMKVYESVGCIWANMTVYESIWSYINVNGSK